MEKIAQTNNIAVYYSESMRFQLFIGDRNHTPTFTGELREMMVYIVKMFAFRFAFDLLNQLHSFYILENPESK